MKLLITSGGTREPIDAARFITNLSTGATGAALAGALAARGCSALCLCAEGAVKPAGRGIRVREFSCFADLDTGLRRALAAEAFDAVIHLAAVSDYSPALIEADGRRILPGCGAKLDSSSETVLITLRRNFKIIDRIKDYAAAGGRPGPLLVGFKLTAGAGPEKIAAKVRALAAADLVVHNDLAEMKKAHVFHLYRDGARAGSCCGPAELAGKIFEFIKTGTEAPCY